MRYMVTTAYTTSSGISVIGLTLSLETPSMGVVPMPSALQVGEA